MAGINNTKLEVLIQESEIIVLFDLKTMLQKNGYKITGCYLKKSDLHDALEITSPDFVIIDHSIDIRRAESNYFNLPVICLSAYEFVDKSLNFNSEVEYLNKPFSEKELLNAIDKLKQKTPGNYLIENEQTIKL